MKKERGGGRRKEKKRSRGVREREGEVEGWAEVLIDVERMARGRDDTTSRSGVIRG